MVVFVYPDTLFNMSLEAAGDYLSHFMKCLITDTGYQRGPDGKYHHHQVPCNRLQDHIIRHLPPFYASEVTPRLMRYVIIRYVILIHSAAKSACEEMAPHVLRAVIHPSVNQLDLNRDSLHPKLIDYYKEMELELIYRTLPLLTDLIAVKLGKSYRIINVPLEVDGFSNTLEEFSCREFWERDLSILAHKCKHMKRLEMGVPIDYLLKAFCYISRFQCLEELNLSRMIYLPDVELQRILSWLTGVVPTDESAEETAQRAGLWQDSGIASCAESPPTFPPCCPGLLTSFGCANAKESHIIFISKFYNLTSLVLSSLLRVKTLAPLESLKMLKNFALVRTAFIVAQEFLQSIGNQLICLNLIDVWETDFSFISYNCRSL
jgi:hypothetical protein